MRKCKNCGKEEQGYLSLLDENELCFDCRKHLFSQTVKKVITWSDLKFYCGASINAESIQCPRNDKQYNAPSVSFYEDGTVWVSGAKGSVQMYKNCPYWLMCEIFKQRYNEVLGFNINE